MPISNQKEVIDTRILGLIGLEDVFDLDYETYLTLLKEAMVKGRMAKTTIPTEEVELLTNEYKRVKTKKDKGRFQVKEKKITSNSFAVGSIRAKLGATRTKALLPASIAKSPITSNLDESISIITSTISSIAETLKAQKKLTDDTSSFDKRKSEQDKRSLAESKLEKRFEGLKKTAEKIIAPVKSLLDKVLEFFTTILLGRVVYKLVEWLGDPENSNKVKSIIRFLGDWWPALLGAYVLFGNSFSGLIRGTMGIVGRFIFQIGKVAIPQLLKFLKSPLGIGVGLFTAGATIPALLPGTVNDQERKTQKASGSPEDKIRSLQQQKANLSLFEKLQGKGAEINEQIYSLQSGKTKSYGFSGGGLANGYVSGEKGIDKVPAMLSDGEFVMSRGAVSKYGVDTLESMNAAGGGTNKPKVVSGTTYAAGGGLIGMDTGEGKVNANIPFTKDPIGAIGRFVKFKFGADLGKQSTWGIPSLGAKKSSTSTGSLLTDPVGAVARIANNMGIKTPNVPQASSSRRETSGTGNPLSRVMNFVKNKTGGKKSGEKSFLDDLRSATFRDAGSIYAKQMLGGVGGPISEMDLGGESQQELQKAIQRAKKRTGSEIRKAEAKIKELKSQGAKDGNPALETQKSFLKKLKSGGIRVQYADYGENGKMTESAKNAKNILGQFWANKRSAKEGGGYRVEDKYDFNKMKDPMKVLTQRGSTTQQRLQALFLMNPFAAKKEVDMVLGGKRTAAEIMGLSGSKSLLGGMLGISGRPAPITPTKANIARTKPKNTRGVKPPTSTRPRVIYGPPAPKRRNVRGGRTTSTKTPRFNATTKGMRSKQETLGLLR
jgi:hypothetical protein